MAVMIRGLIMPKDCDRCPCMRYECVAYDEPIGCVFTGKTYRWSSPGRPKDCPLVEVGNAEYVSEEEECRRL